jgi:hypothetical protein
MMMKLMEQEVEEEEVKNLNKFKLNVKISFYFLIIIPNNNSSNKLDDGCDGGGNGLGGGGADTGLFTVVDDCRIA